MFGFSQPKVPQIDSENVKQALDAGDKVILLDVRTPGEYANGKIKTSINIPLQDIKSKAHELLPDTSAKIYTYCLSGGRSVVAVDQLLKLGYTNVFDMKSGLLSWRAKGYPLIV